MSDINISASYFIRRFEDIEGLEALAQHNIQLGLSMNQNDIVKYTKEIASRNDIKINSVHLPKLGPEETYNWTMPLKELFGVNRFTIHPEKKNVENFTYEWLPILKNLEREGIQISFENSNSNQSVLRNPYNIPDQKPFYLTLDVQHLPKYMDEMEVFKDLKDKILIVHLTNREITAPYERYNVFLTNMFRNPEIEYVLEYGRDHIPEMIQQYKSIKRLYEKWSRDNPSGKH